LFCVAHEDPKNLLPTLHWEAREAFEELSKRYTAAHPKYGLKVRSARRSCKEQNEQYRMGYSKVRGCKSWHVLGRAIDADPMYLTGSKAGKLVPDCRIYTLAGKLWEQMGGTWGGRWLVFGPCGDGGHFQWSKGTSMAALCPDPTDCRTAEASIQTRRPLLGMLAWGLGGFAVIAGGYGLYRWLAPKT
jgi:hypothetical protein